MILAKWKVYWSEYSSDTYLYGSEIKYHSKDHVEFYNELMPPGTVIKRWYSKTNYQRQRIEPTLPMIDGESAYKFSVNVSKDDENSNFLFRIVFLDKYENEAGAIFVRDKEQCFRCPLKTYSYQIELINSGIKHFHFKAFTIEEIDLKTYENTINKSSERKKSIKNK